MRVNRTLAKSFIARSLLRHHSQSFCHFLCFTHRYLPGQQPVAELGELLVFIRLLLCQSWLRFSTYTNADPPPSEIPVTETSKIQASVESGVADSWCALKKTQVSGAEIYGWQYFIPMKILFHADETFISYWWKFCFILMKLLFCTDETFF